MTVPELIALLQPMMPPYPDRDDRLQVYLGWWVDAAKVLSARLAESDAYVSEYARQCREALDAQCAAELKSLNYFVETANSLAAADKLRDSLNHCRVILRHKEIRPPMFPGVQEKIEKEADEAIAAWDAAKGGA